MFACTLEMVTWVLFSYIYNICVPNLTDNPKPRKMEMGTSIFLKAEFVKMY